MQEFQEKRKSAIRMQTNAYAVYEEEMEAIGVVDEEYEFFEDDAVDPNLARQLGIDKEGDGDGMDDDWENEEDVFGGAGKQYSILEGKSIKKRYYLPKDRSATAPSMKEKKNMREKLFGYLDEARIGETRLELAFELAMQNQDDEDMELTKKLDEMAEDLYLERKKNATALFDFMDAYSPNPTGKLWGNDVDYMTMLKSLSAINQIDSGGTAMRKSIAESKVKNKGR